MHAPKIPKNMIFLRLLEFCFAWRLASANNDIMPPSPLLSARMIKTIYLMDTIKISDHVINERMP